MGALAGFYDDLVVSELSIRDTGRSSKLARRKKYRYTFGLHEQKYQDLSEIRDAKGLERMDSDEFSSSSYHENLASSVLCHSNSKLRGRFSSFAQSRGSETAKMLMVGQREGRQQRSVSDADCPLSTGPHVAPPPS